jgi:type II secretory pathway component GspD/PulD (secretin)
VSLQEEPAAEVVPPAQETPPVAPPIGGAVAAADAPTTEPAAEPAALAPIVVIASEGRITIASRDAVALDQFENLWKMLQRGRRVRIEAGNYSMFLLQNADATQLAEVLEQLFRRGPRGGGGESYRPYFRRSAPLTVVADERMNALLVYGSVADRQAVEEILDVLDSMDLPESLTTPRPRMIPVKNLPANNVLTVLETVYRTQLSARSGVRPMTIPQGISFEMTSMLQLINAAAEAPLLTLDVDRTTNSIVMRAPRQLGEEIEEFIAELDEQAKDGGKRNISLVPLKTMNTSEVQDALQMLMRGGGRFRGR